MNLDQLGDADEPWDSDEHFKRDYVILKFIFNKVGEDIIKLECDNATILEQLCARGWMSEEERQSVISCGTIHSDKNK